jgi:hypothetical protein
MVQNPLGDRVDAEALEHAIADLRMSFEHEPLRVGEWARLAQDLLGHRELSQVVKARGEAGQLDLLLVEAHPFGDARREVGDALRVAALVDVACVDRAREARGGAEARRAVGAARELLQLSQLDDLRAVDADAVLSVLLRPVERTVREADQLVPADSLDGERRHAGADRDLLGVVELHLAEPLDDRRGGVERRSFVVVDQEHGELVAAEAERLASLPETRGDLRENAVAGGVAVVVVDPLEVVDVDEAETELLVRVLCRDELALQSLVEVAVVSQAGQWVG